MRSNRLLIAGLLVLASACSKEPPAMDHASPATIKDIMDSMVEPSADVLFESVAEIADEKGITQKAPRTDAEWQQVRRHAVVLLEAPNLLIMKGRRIAQPHERSENPQVELQPEDIQKLVDGDRPSFVRGARMLQDSAALALKAIDGKDKSALFDALVSIDKACENCHLHYWYPNDQRALQAARERGIVE